MEKPTWIVEIEKMKAQRDDARAHNNILMDQVTEAEMQAAWCKEQLAAAVAALKAVEWIHDDMTSYCPWCRGRMEDLSEDERREGFVIGHKPDCQRQAAIAAVEGK